eukprot:1102074-Pyramimonas_sp.AAC.1
MTIDRQIIGYQPKLLPRDPEAVSSGVKDGVFGTPERGHGSKEANQIVFLPPDDVVGLGVRSQQNVSINTPVSVD